MTATLILTIVCTIGLMAAGMSLFAYTRTRGRAYRLRRVQATTHQLKPASQANLPPSLQHLTQLTQNCLNELNVLDLYNEQIAVLAQSVDHERKRPLWHRLEGANYDYAVAKAAIAIREWISHFETLAAEEREIVLRLGIESHDLHALLATDLDAENQYPENHRNEVAAARLHLSQALHSLSSYTPAAYR